MPFTVTILADNWPKETSWFVKNIDMNETIAEGDNDKLVPGEPVVYNECLKSKMGCYEFTIIGEIFVVMLICYLINSDFRDALLISTSCTKILAGTDFVVRMEAEATKSHGMVKV